MSGLKLKLYLILYYISKSSINLECLSKIQIHSPQVTSTKSVSVIQELFKTNLCINSSAVPGLNPPAMQETSWIRRIRWRRDRLPTPVFLGFPCGSASKESACNEGNMGSIAGLGRSPGEGNGYPLQYSGLENFMESMRNPWGCKESETTERLSLSLFFFHWVLAEGLGTLCEIKKRFFF